MDSKLSITIDIKQFLTRKTKIIKFKLTCPDLLFSILENLGATLDYDNDPMEINGWQYDWWMNADYKGQKLRLSGSGFYGNGQIEKVKE